MSYSYVVTGSGGSIGSKLIESFVYEGILRSNILQVHRNTLNEEITEWCQSRDKIVIIHCAGVSLSHSFGKFNRDKILSEFQTNVLYALDITSLLWDHMKSNTFGRIVFMGSVTAHLGVFGTLGYAMSKSSLESAARVLTIEGKKNNILAYNIALGYTDCGMTDSIPDNELIRKQIPLGRFASGNEISESIRFLIDCPYMAGQSLHLNGGLYLS